MLYKNKSMKKLIYSFGLALCMAGSLMAQTGLHFQWHSQYAMGTPSLYDRDSVVSLCKVGYNVSGGLNAMALLNLNTTTFSYLNSPISPSLNPFMVMKNRKEGMVYTSPTNVYITNDNWQTSILHSTLSIVPYFSTRAGYLGSSGAASPFSLQFSPNGTNWSAVGSSTTYPQYVRGNSKLFVYDDDKMYVSTNGGSAFSTVTFTGSMGAGKLCAADDDSLFIFGQNNFKRSVNGGTSWISGTLPSTMAVVDAACKNGREIIVRFVNTQLTQRYVYYSTNSGANWTQLTSFNTQASEQLYATREYFIIYPSQRSVSGSTWTPLFPKVKSGAFDINFTGNTGLAGFDGGYVAYSNNRGASFVISDVKPSNEDITAVKVLPNGKCLAGDRKGQIFESTNNGATWQSRVTNAISNLIAVKFLYSQNTNTIILHRQGQPLMSVDGGTSYVIVNVGGGQHCQAQQPVAGSLIDVGGVYPSPNFTLSGWDFNRVDANGVKTLLSTLTPTGIGNQSILDIHMADDNTGFFVARNSSSQEVLVYKTTDAWQSVSLVSAIPAAAGGTYVNAKMQSFGTSTLVLSGTGAASSNTVTFYHVSTDGGQSWNQVSANFSVPNNSLGNKIYKAHFFNENEFMALISDNFTGYIVASEGAYLHVSEGNGGIVSIKEFGAAAQSSRVLLYPNPASGAFRISGEDNTQRVEIYNLSGQLVKFQDLEAGSRESEIGIGELAPGIYLVNLQFTSGLKSQAKLVIRN